MNLSAQSLIGRILSDLILWLFRSNISKLITGWSMSVVRAHGVGRNQQIPTGQK